MEALNAFVSCIFCASQPRFITVTRNEFQPLWSHMQLIWSDPQLEDKPSRCLGFFSPPVFSRLGCLQLGRQTPSGKAPYPQYPQLPPSAGCAVSTSRAVPASQRVPEDPAAPAASERRGNLNPGRSQVLSALQPSLQGWQSQQGTHGSLESFSSSRLVALWLTDGGSSARPAYTSFACWMLFLSTDLAHEDGKRAAFSQLCVLNIRLTLVNGFSQCSEISETTHPSSAVFCLITQAATGDNIRNSFS